MKKLTVKMYHKQNFYTIYNGDKELNEGDIDERDIKQILTDNGYQISSLRIGVSYSYDISVWLVEVK